MWESVLSFSHVGPKEQMRVTGLGIKQTLWSTKHLTVLLRVVLKQNMRLTHTDCVPHAPDMKLFWSHLASRYFRIRVENQKRKKKTKQHLIVSQHIRKQGGRQLPLVVLISRMPLALVTCYLLVTELSAPFGTRQTSLKCIEPQNQMISDLVLVSLSTQQKPESSERGEISIKELM